MIRFANAKNSGVAKNSSMIVPCMVNIWLYCSGDRNCSPGRASSPRISSAIAPPAIKKANDVVRYSSPICFGSVVRSSASSVPPFGPRRATAKGTARRVGSGFTSVIRNSCRRTVRTGRNTPADWITRYPERVELLPQRREQLLLGEVEEALLLVTTDLDECDVG